MTMICFVFQATNRKTIEVHPPDDGSVGPSPPFRVESQTQGPRGLRQLHPLQRRRKPPGLRVRRSQDLHLGLGEEAEGLLLQVGPYRERVSVQVFALHRYSDDESFVIFLSYSLQILSGT